MRPVARNGDLAPTDEALLGLVAEGKPIKAIALARQSTPAAVSRDIERLFEELATKASAGVAGAVRRLRMLHEAIVSREEIGETVSRLLPGGVVDMLRREGWTVGHSETVEVTILMSDIRGYTTIAEHAEPTRLAAQLNRHRAEMNRAIIGHGGTVMQYVGDAVMAVFGAPSPTTDHADRALAAAWAMHEAQTVVNAGWERDGLAPFGLGIGVSTGEVAAALLGSEERVEYTMVGDAVNLCQRLQQYAAPGQIVVSEATWSALGARPDAFERLPCELVKGRDTAVAPYRLGPG
jgi:class 3 adenylate cyclase